MSVDIKAGRLRLRAVTDIEVNSSWKNLTTTASVSFPRSAYINGQAVKVRDYVKVGDSVVIKVGYNDNLNTEFEGYVARINPNRPFQFECEDEMYKLKRTSITKLFAAGTKLKTLIKAIYSGPLRLIDDNLVLGEFNLNKASGAQVLEELKRTYNLYGFFRGKTLVVGFPYDPTIQQTHVFDPDYNMTRKDGLVYRTKDETQTKITGISLKPDNTHLTYVAGESGGDEQTRNFYNIPYDALKQAVDREYKMAVYEGWRGRFTAWGIPFVKHGDVVKLRNNYYPEYNGSYLVDGTVLRVSKSGGIRRDIIPGPAATAIAA